MNDIERRYVPDSTMEMRGLPGQGVTLTGHAAVFDREAVIWGFREMVAPKAFRKTLAEADVRALFNHDPNHVLGRNRAKTLRLTEDAVGLAYEIDLPDTQFALDLARSIERGDISQSSFAFETIKDEWTYPKKDENVLPLRKLTEVKLYDISPVTYPAYDGTDVDLQRALRSLAHDLARPLDELVAAARAGELYADTTEEPVDEPPKALVATQSPGWQRKARMVLKPYSLEAS